MTACARKGKISSRARKKLPARAFALPAKRKYPLYKQVSGRLVPSATHARNAKARASAQRRKGNLTAREKASVDRKANAVIAKCRGKASSSRAKGNFCCNPKRKTKGRWSKGPAVSCDARDMCEVEYLKGARTIRIRGTWSEIRNLPREVKDVEALGFPIVGRGTRAELDVPRRNPRRSSSRSSLRTTPATTGTLRGWRWRVIKTNAGWRGQVLASTPTSCIVIGRPAKTKAKATSCIKRWIDRQGGSPDTRGCKWPSNVGNLAAARGVKRNPRRAPKAKANPGKIRSLTRL